MALTVVQSPADLQTPAAADALRVIGFFGDFSAAARRARPHFEAFAAANPGLDVRLVDGGAVKGVHTQFGVTAVPTAISLRGEQVIRTVAGEQKPDYYERALVPHGDAADARGEDAPKQPPVTVYTSPTCVWCTRIKQHLRKHRVRFTEVDVSRDPQAAESLVRRSGQRGVPQTDIGGTLIVGFDQKRIDTLLKLN